jgi:formylglycine-generating enzyme required for sulfatase activity
MRSQQELREASGYVGRAKDFDQLLRILDSELRLITPTDPEGVESENSTARPPTGGKYYQLTHDYLVHSLRDWLTRKQKETRRGWAELLLADRASVWKARPENRQLPSLWQWLQIRWLTNKKNWTPPQQKMMRRATRYHAVRGLVLSLVLVALSATGWIVQSRIGEQSNAHRAAGLVERVLDAETPQAPAIVEAMAGYRHWTDPLLREEYQKAQANSQRQLHASLALLPADATQVEYLYQQLLDAQPHQVPVIRDFLAAYKSELVGRLWRVAEQPDPSKESQRLRAAAALATYDPESERWAKVQDAVGKDLVGVPAVYLSEWMKALRPVRTKLLPSLSALYRDPKRRETERSLATDLLADYAADQPALLADLLMDAEDKQFAVLYPKFREQGARGLSELTGEIDKNLSADAKDEAKEKLAKRQANAAVVLLRMNQPAKVWPLLKHSSDPRTRSYLIHRLSPLRADAGAISKRLDEEPDVTIRRALLLSLGEYGDKELSPDTRTTLLPKVQDLYRTDPDPGLHAAAEWLLRTWQQEAWLQQVNGAWAKDKGQRQKRLESIQQSPTKDQAKTPQWYVNGQGQTMVVIPGPMEFQMGSPSTEEGRRQAELQHKQRIGRMFAIAAKAVTLEQYRKFEPRHGVGEIERWARTPDSPVTATNWYQAAAYCNWLSEQEGLAKSEWCYEPLVDRKALSALAGSSAGLLAGWFGPLAATGGLLSRRIDSGYKEGMKLAQNYLQRRGYRLPTEAEWEYACRAGAVTSRYYGETEELLEKYAWYLKSAQYRVWPVGSKKPNDLGLFDMYGNVWTWCQERYKNYPQGKGEKANEDKEDYLSINNDDRLLRGSAFNSQAVDVRSARRGGLVPALRGSGIGLRSARTFTP